MPARKCSCGCGQAGRYLGRLEVNGEAHYLGYFYLTRPSHKNPCRSRRSAREAKRQELLSRAGTEERNCESVVAEYLEEYEERHKASSLDTCRLALQPFRSRFGARPIGAITRQEAKDWTRSVSKSYVPNVVTLFNWAVREGIVDRNVFTGLGHRGKGRSELDAPKLEEVADLMDACAVLGDYGDRMRDFLVFASYTLMRPSELYELRWSDIDFAAGDIHKERRLYRGRLDTPKTGRRVVPLPGPAEAILMRQPTRGRDDGLVFTSKTGKRLSGSTFSQYWALVQARAGRDREDPRTDPYFVTKHYGVHLLAKEGLSARAIAAQAGWEESTAEAMMKVYGHLREAGMEEMKAHWRAQRQPVEPTPSVTYMAAPHEVEADESARLLRIVGEDSTGWLTAEEARRFADGYEGANERLAPIVRIVADRRLTDARPSHEEREAAS